MIHALVTGKLIHCKTDGNVLVGRIVLDDDKPVQFTAKRGAVKAALTLMAALRTGPIDAPKISFRNHASSVTSWSGGRKPFGPGPDGSSLLLARMYRHQKRLI